MPAARPNHPPSIPPAEVLPSHDGDFYSWTLAQAAALRDGAWHELDLANLAEEIEALGRGEFNQLMGAYRVILIHMLKWDHQPERRSRSWATSIRTQRIDVDDVLADNPGLSSRRDQAVARAYRRARIQAGTETGLSERTFPTSCPYTLDEIMNRSFASPEM
jgi:hypothetical protein